MRGMSKPETAQVILDGFLFYYNYLRPHESLNNRTPAEVAGIKLPYRNWIDVIRASTPMVADYSSDAPVKTYRVKLYSKKRRKKPKKSASLDTTISTLRGDQTWVINHDLLEPTLRDQTISPTQQLKALGIQITLFDSA